jgi:hypothetical protein
MEDSRQHFNEEADELRPEYDLEKLRVRRLGPARKRFCKTSIETDNEREYPSTDPAEDTPDESDLC